MDLLTQIRQKFNEIFEGDPEVTGRAPGRANIIGEHTDYNGGFVLPIGIDKNIYTAASRREDDIVNIFSLDFNESASFNINELKFDKTKLWVNYPKGVISELISADFKISGFNMVFGGDIPVAVGLSSSAALECAVAVTLKKLNRLKIDKMEMVKLCQRAENNFVGVKCGIMDQFASCMAKADSAIFLDCKTLKHEYIPFKLKEFFIVLCNTNKKRELVDSEYNKRKNECEKGVEFFKTLNNRIESLRDVPVELFETNKQSLQNITGKRCEHVIYENRRVIECISALRRRKIFSVGNLLFQSHYSLKDLYEVSCMELDILVEIAKKTDGCFGSRMMGAGFGGCTINLVHKDNIEEFSQTIRFEYHKKTGIVPDIYICKVEEGAGIIE